MQMSTQAAPSSWPSQGKQIGEPSMKEQLQQRRAGLLIELRDIEQALEQMEANPNFEAVMRTIIKAHRY